METENRDLIKKNKDLEKKFKDLEKKIKDLEKKYKLENEFLLAKFNCANKKSNRGEKDEVLLMIKLFYLNQKEQYDKLVEILGEESSKGINLISAQTNNEILDIHKLVKANGNFKADCIIKMKKTNTIYNLSIKSKNGANPAILNHTPRTAKVFKENDGILFSYVNTLDLILSEYIDKRNKKKIKEDVKVNELEILKNPTIKNDLIDVLVYFIFNGSGKGYSSCKANSIICYQEDKILFLKCKSIDEKKKYVKSIFDRLVISLRDKGMPKKINEYCKNWIYNDHKQDGTLKYKGCLHIRLN